MDIVISFEEGQWFSTNWTRHYIERCYPTRETCRVINYIAYGDPKPSWMGFVEIADRIRDRRWKRCAR